MYLGLKQEKRHLDDPKANAKRNNYVTNLLPYLLEGTGRAHVESTIFRTST